MMALPAPLGGKELIAWRIDPEEYADTWDSGLGAFTYGGRWNSPGQYAVYCAIDPSTSILELAVHKGFAKLDTVSHVLTSLVIHEPKSVYVVRPEHLPNPNWLLHSGRPSEGQQEYGDALLKKHKVILIPSAVSRHSWNLIFLGGARRKPYALKAQERFALDTRLHPPKRS